MQWTQRTAAEYAYRPPSRSGFYEQLKIRPSALKSCSLSSSIPAIKNQQFLLRHFTHQRQQVALGVVKKRHPQIVVGHSGDEVGFILETHAAGQHPAVCCFDVRHVEIENRTGRVELCFFCWRQHQAHAATIEERQVPGGEQQRQTQDVAVEFGGASGIVCVNG